MKKFKIYFTIFISINLSTAAFSQTIRTYDLSGFQKLNMGSAFHIHVIQGNSFKVIAKGAKKDLDRLEVYTKNNTLVAGFENNWNWWGRNNSEKIEFQIEMPSILSVNFSGASNSTITGFDDLNTLNIELSGASKSKIDVFSNNMSVEVSGASKLNLIGRSNKLTLSMSGASSVEATNFPVKIADIDASGASSARLSVSQSINYDASGASNVKYIGNAKVSKSTSGAANINRLLH